MAFVKKHLWRVLPLFVILIYIGLVFVCAKIIDDDVLAQIIADVITIVGGGFLYVKLLKDRDIEPFKPQAWFWMLFVCYIILTWVVSQATGLMILNHVKNTGFDEYAKLADSNIAMYGVLSVFIAPFAEEIVFRGLVYTFWRKHLTAFASACFSAILFSFLHGTLVHLPIAFLVGLISAYMYELSGKLRYAILVHFLFNALSASLVIPVAEWAISIPFCVVTYVSFLICLCFMWKYIDKMRAYVITEHLLDKINKKPH